jgi:hypothetical protein
MIIAKSKKKCLFTAIILLSMILIAFIACSTSNYGKLKSNPEVTQAFESYQILPNHKYYYRGSFDSPLAIVGINENYELNSKLWVEIDPQSKNFRSLIDRVSVQGMGRTIQPWGFMILDHGGNDVGVWYSAIRQAAVEINENNQIVILSPIPTASIGVQRK